MLRKFPGRYHLISVGPNDWYSKKNYGRRFHLPRRTADEKIVESWWKVIYRNTPSAENIWRLVSVDNEQNVGF